MSKLAICNCLSKMLLSLNKQKIPRKKIIKLKKTQKKNKKVENLLMKNLQFLQKRPKKRYKNIKLGYIEEEGGDTKFKLNAK